LYGLATYRSASSIHLVSPLPVTKATISTNNDVVVNGELMVGQNYGGQGTIKSVDNDGKVLEIVYDGRPTKKMTIIKTGLLENKKTT
jgi:hypothetical protein